MSFAVTPLVNRAASSKTDIVRVAKDIHQGKRIAEDDIQTVSVGAHNLPENVIKDPAEVIGQYAATDLKTDDYLLPGKLSANADSADDVFKALDGERQAMSISIRSFAGGVSGKLKNGDIVSIIVSGKNAEDPTLIPPELKYIRVITTTTSNGSDAEQQEQDDENNDQPATVTLLVNEAQSVLLAGYEANAVIHISLVYRGDADKANQFLQAQQTVLDELEQQRLEAELEEAENPARPEASAEPEEMIYG